MTVQTAWLWHGNCL